MKSTTEIYSIADKEGIIIDIVKFKSKNILGMYFKEEGIPPIIGINKSIENDERLLRTVLAEEIGHHFTSIGDLTSECFTYSETLIKCKYEKLARKWASDFLIQDSELIAALKKGITTTYDLANLFFVTEELIKFKLDIMSKRNSVQALKSLLSADIFLCA